MEAGDNLGRAGEFGMKWFPWMTVSSIVMASFALTGCYDREELEQQAFVIIMGVDAAPRGMVDCSFQIALPKTLSPSGGGGGTQPLAGSGPITYRAHNMLEAMTLASSSVEREITFSHLGLVIFGDELARRGLSEPLQTLTRFREFRRTTYVAVSKGPARALMGAGKPMLETSASRLVDDIAQAGVRTGFLPQRMRLQDVVIALTVPHENVVMPMFAINTHVEADPKGEKGPAGDKPSYVAGDVNRAAGNPVEWMGAAVFRKDKMVGTLDGQEQMLLRMMRGSVRRMRVNYPDPGDPTHYLSLYLQKERAPRYHIRLGTPMMVHIDVPLDAELLASPFARDYTLTGNRKWLEQHLNQALARDMERVFRKLVNDYQVDAIPVSTHARGLFATHDQFARYPWQRKLTTARVSVMADIHVRRFGVQLGPVRTS